jgi:hypothetical protein
MKEKGFLRKSHQKYTGTLWIGIRKKIHSGSGSPIQRVKKHRIPDKDPQH